VHFRDNGASQALLRLPNVHAQPYTARIGLGATIAENVSYDDLILRVLEFMLRAAIARANDNIRWEDEELRREGLRRIEFACDGKALWWDRQTFSAERAEACREGVGERFDAENACRSVFLKKLDADLRGRLAEAGYSSPCLITNMKALFSELAVDARQQATEAQELLVQSILDR
jgi:hypothetical protein